MSKHTLGKESKLDREVQQLLDFASAGSLEHLYHLEYNWPTDLNYARKALEITLSHLDISKFDPATAPSRTSSQELPHKLYAMKASLGILNTAMDYVAGMGRPQVQEMFEVFQPYTSKVIACLDFCACYSSVVMVDRLPAGVSAKEYGNNAGASMTKKLLDVFLKLYEQAEDHNSLTDIVRYVLKSWLRGASGTTPPEETTRTPQEYDLAPAPLFAALSTCIDHLSTRTILHEKLNSFNARAHWNLVKSFEYCCIEWVTVHRPKDVTEALRLDCRYFTTLVSASQELSLVPGFSRALVKFGFTAFALELGLELRQCLSVRTCRGSVATEIASLLFPPRRNEVFEIVGTVPDLLDGGLLDVIIDDLLLLGKTMEDPFYTWYEGNPLIQLVGMSHHPYILDALYSAIEGLPEAVVETIEGNPVALEHWDRFKAATSIHREVHELVLNSDQQTGVCDCLSECEGKGKVSNGGSTSKKCSWCHTVVYCGLDCQRTDWDAFHKSECSGNRYYRINLQNQGGWLSHSSQKSYLGVLGNLFPRIMGAFAPPNHRTSGDFLGRRIYAVDFLEFPAKIRARTGQELLQLRPGGALAFNDARSREIIRESEEDESIHLVVCVWQLGQYYVVALGRFSFHEIENPPLPGSSRPNVTMAYRMINGYVKVVEAVPGILGERCYWE
ncbi:hypothetical protein DFP72DRAFT_1069385 [Ephemerocybe angulata]|uniref:MYND-type domain-containing protein n=1 Tax=Ephemerocybe angulata TaxID=980116 RepID=A0A8H6HW03_9AGAR|nr:hypothetical protein DFP72DRAFT_1069385 [Tulosesus angulatus]